MGLINDLNDLLSRERAEVEATTDILAAMRASDGDLAGGVRDIHDSARWACSGLYHAINHLGSSPGLDVGNLRERIADQQSLPEKLKTLCQDHQRIAAVCQRLLTDNDFDSPTRELVEEIAMIHATAIQWCLKAVEQWTPKDVAE